MKRIGTELIPYTPYGFSKDDALVKPQIKKHKSDLVKLSINKILAEDLLKIIFSTMLCHHDESNQSSMCRHWEIITDSLLEQGLPPQRSKALEDLFLTLTHTISVSKKQKPMINNYLSLLKVTPWMMNEFFENWFLQFISNRDIELCKSAMMNQACKVVKIAAGGNPNVAVSYLVGNEKFEAAFAFVAAIDELNNSRALSEKLVESLISKKGPKETLRIMGEIKCPSYFEAIMKEKHKSDLGKLNINDRIEDAELLKSIFSIMLHERPQPSLPLVCKHWKKNTDSLLSQKFIFQRSYTLRVLLRTLKDMTNLSNVQEKAIEKYRCSLKITPCIAFAEVMDYLNKNQALSEELIDTLIRKDEYKKAFHMISEIKCSDYFFQVYVATGCDQVAISENGYASDLINLEKHPFICSILNYFNPQHSVCVLPKEAANTLICKLIDPLCSQFPFDLSAESIKNRLIQALLDIIPKNFDFKPDFNASHQRLFEFYCSSVVNEDTFPNTYNFKMSQKDADDFIDRLNLVPHAGLRQSIFSIIFERFYRFKPDMIDWWPTINYIEKKSGMNTHAEEQLTRYLIGKHNFIDALNNPGENLVEFPDKFLELIMKNPRFLNEFELVENDHDMQSTSEEPPMDISEETSEGLFEASSSSDDSNIEYSMQEIFDVYQNVINFLIGKDQVSLAISVVNFIALQPLRDKIQKSFKLSPL